jgi:serine/threonine-protein kinase
MRPRAEALAASAGRLGPPASLGDGRDAALRRHDGWLDRDVLVLPASPEALERARGFARAGHAALSPVLRVDRESGEIWVAAPLGKALADEPRGLSPGQAARLAEALEALHGAGAAHGWVDAEHLYFHDGEITLAFPRRDEPPDAAQRDQEALAGLGLS